MQALNDMPSFYPNLVQQVNKTINGTDKIFTILFSSDLGLYPTKYYSTISIKYLKKNNYVLFLNFQTGKMPLLEEATGNPQIEILEIAQGSASFSKFQLLIENSSVEVIDFNDNVKKVWSPCSVVLGIHSLLYNIFLLNRWLKHVLSCF